MTHLDPNSPQPDRSAAPAEGPEIELLFLQIGELRPEFSARELLGETVSNDAGEDIGSLDDLLIEDDEVAYAVLSVGGFLGLGAHKVVAPFENLIVNDGGIVLPGASKEVLNRMAKYDRDELRMNRRPGHRRHRDEPPIDRTAAGEPMPRAVTEISDGEV